MIGQTDHVTTEQTYSEISEKNDGQSTDHRIRNTNITTVK